MALVFSGMILLIGAITVFFEKGFWVWMSLAIVLVVLVATNLLVSTQYRVQKEGNQIVIENMWRRKTYDVGDLLEIRLVKFVIPYPFNPFVKFSFRDGKSFIGSIPRAFFIYFGRGGIGEYLDDLRQQWRLPKGF